MFIIFAEEILTKNKIMSKERFIYSILAENKVKIVNKKGLVCGSNSELMFGYIGYTSPKNKYYIKKRELPAWVEHN